MKRRGLNFSNQLILVAKFFLMTKIDSVTPNEYRRWSIAERKEFWKEECLRVGYRTCVYGVGIQRIMGSMDASHV